MELTFPTFVRASHDSVGDGAPAPTLAPQKSLLELVIEANGQLGRVPQRQQISRKEFQRQQRRYQRGRWADEMGESSSSSSSSAGEGEGEEAQRGGKGAGHGTADGDGDGQWESLDAATLWARRPLSLTRWCPPQSLFHAWAEKRGLAARYEHVHGVRCVTQPLAPASSSALLAWRLQVPLLAWRDLRLPALVRVALLRELSKGQRPRLAGELAVKAQELTALLLQGTQSAQQTRPDNNNDDGGDGDDDNGAASDVADDGAAREGGGVEVWEERENVALLRGIQQFAMTPMLEGHHAVLCGPHGSGKRTAVLVAAAANTLAWEAHALEGRTDAGAAVKQEEGDEGEGEDDSLRPRAVILVNAYGDILKTARWLRDVFGPEAFAPLTFSRNRRGGGPESGIDVWGGSGGPLWEPIYLPENAPASYPSPYPINSVYEPPETPLMEQGMMPDPTAVLPQEDALQNLMKLVQEGEAPSMAVGAVVKAEGRCHESEGHKRSRSESDGEEEDRHRRRHRSRDRHHHHHRSSSSRSHRRDYDDGHHRRHRRRDGDDTDDNDDEGRERHHRPRSRRDGDREHDRHHRHHSSSNKSSRRRGGSERDSGLSDSHHSSGREGRSRRSRHDKDHEDVDADRHRQYRRSSRRGSRSASRSSSSSSTSTADSRKPRDADHHHHHRHRDERRSDKPEVKDTSAVAGREVPAMGFSPDALMNAIKASSSFGATWQSQPQSQPQPQPQPQSQPSQDTLAALRDLRRRVPVLIATPHLLQESIQLQSFLVATGMGIDGGGGVGGGQELNPMTIGAAVSALPLDKVRVFAVVEAERAVALPPLKETLSRTHWIALTNSVDVECQYLLTSDRLGAEVLEFVSSTLLPDVNYVDDTTAEQLAASSLPATTAADAPSGSASRVGRRQFLFAWTQSDETIGEFVHTRVEAAPADKPSEDHAGRQRDGMHDGDDEARKQARSRAWRLENERAKVTHTVALIHQHFATCEEANAAAVDHLRSDDGGGHTERMGENGESEGNEEAESQRRGGDERWHHFAERDAHLFDLGVRAAPMVFVLASTRREQQMLLEALPQLLNSPDAALGMGGGVVRSFVVASTVISLSDQQHQQQAAAYRRGRRDNRRNVQAEVDTLLPFPSARMVYVLTEMQLHDGKELRALRQRQRLLAELLTHYRHHNGYPSPHHHLGEDGRGRRDSERCSYPIDLLANTLLLHYTLPWAVTRGHTGGGGGADAATAAHASDTPRSQQELIRGCLEERARAILGSTARLLAWQQGYLASSLSPSHSPAAAAAAAPRGKAACVVLLADNERISRDTGLWASLTENQHRM